MNGQKILGVCIGFGIVAGVAGIYQCARGYIYSVASKHETTTVGRITRMGHSRGGAYYQYVFSVNGAKVDDDSDVCSTPLTPDACWNNGPVVVHYSYEPFSNSRLEGFKVASKNSYKTGATWLIIATSLFLFGIAASALSRRGKGDGDAMEEIREDEPEDLEKPIHVIPNA